MLSARPLQDHLRSTTHGPRAARFPSRKDASTKRRASAYPKARRCTRGRSGDTAACGSIHCRSASCPRMLPPSRRLWAYKLGICRPAATATTPSESAVSPLSNIIRRWGPAQQAEHCDCCCYQLPLGKYGSAAGSPAPPRHGVAPRTSATRGFHALSCYCVYNRFGSCMLPGRVSVFRGRDCLTVSTLFFSSFGISSLRRATSQAS